MKRKLEVAPYILSTNFLPHMGERVVAIEEGVDRSLPVGILIFIL